MIVAGRSVRASLSGDSFVDIAPGVAVIGISSAGVEFAADLTVEQVADVWWFITSTDAADETARRHLKALLAANDPGLCAALVRYVLGP